MKFRLVIGALAAFIALVGELGLSSLANARDENVSDTPVAVNSLTEEDINRIVDKRIQDILNRGPRVDEVPTDFSKEPGVGQTEKSQKRLNLGSQDWVTGGSVLEGGRTIYAKPFVRNPKTIIGGYIDFTISDCNNANSRDCREGLEFDQERFVPFFYSQVTDRLSVAAELEIEHGGPQGNQNDGDVKMEFATMDYRFDDWANLRAGIVLIPMGRFNLTHDSPLNDLPLRPMVSRLIIPSTFAESGVGLFGSFYPTALSKVDYEFYVTQGYDGGSSNTGTSITEGSGMRSSRGSFSSDNNENKALVSRVSVSPFLGVEMAGSIHYGKWNDEGNKHLTTLAVDGLLQRGPFEILGEAAWNRIQGGKSNPDPGTGVPPKRMMGYFVQTNFHFMPEIFRQMAPTHFGESSTFTAVARWGEADTNTQSSRNVNDLQRMTLGLNFRPVEDAVLKFGWTWNDHKDAPESRNGWQLSWATYF
jgi:hypothetical protein